MPQEGGNTQLKASSNIQTQLNTRNLVQIKERDKTETGAYDREASQLGEYEVIKIPGVSGKNARKLMLSLASVRNQPIHLGQSDWRFANHALKNVHIDAGTIFDVSIAQEVIRFVRFVTDDLLIPNLSFRVINYSITFMFTLRSSPNIHPETSSISALDI
ncbi:uncharacterized protein RCO7_10401 [Rhynchosporium graminicola]|uniref:Uncharacterized protein n=1 Tax=Rhynchosporium graminicola TaxID=2792576 RepID=A0A1E1L529_9HELO|nr:uncharacterized protein RCO7_10401 [Rhynchosporium commune]